MLVDTAYFSDPSEKLIDYVIDLKKIDNSLNGAAVHSDQNTFDLLRQNSQQPFRFGEHQAINLMTRGRTGWGRVAFVLFHRGRPIDEINTAFCIGSDCVPRHLLVMSLKGLILSSSDGERITLS